MAALVIDNGVFTSGGKRHKYTMFLTKPECLAVVRALESLKEQQGSFKLDEQNVYQELHEYFCSEAKR